MSNLKFRLVVEQDGKDVHTEELSVFMLRSLAPDWRDGSFSPELLGYFAQYPDVEVANRAAGDKRISDSTLEILAKSKSLEIRRKLIGNDKFRDWASTELLIEYANADVEAASNIAGSLEYFKTADHKTIIEFFLKHPNPYVRYCIVDDYPKLSQKVLKTLQANDPDSSVRERAKRGLEDR